MTGHTAPKGYGRDAYAACAARGLSQTEAAAFLGVSKVAVHAAARRHGLDFTDGRSSDLARARATEKMMRCCKPGCREARARVIAMHEAGYYRRFKVMTGAQRQDYQNLRRKLGLSIDDALAQVRA